MFDIMEMAGIGEAAVDISAGMRGGSCPSIRGRFYERRMIFMTSSCLCMNMS